MLACLGRIEALVARQAVRIEPEAIYTVEEASALLGKGMSEKTLRKKLRARVLRGKREGVRGPWRICGAELLRFGGKDVKG